MKEGRLGMSRVARSSDNNLWFMWHFLVEENLEDLGRFNVRWRRDCEIQDHRIEKL